MKYSLHLGHPFGIKLSVHWTFLLIILWVIAINITQGADLTQILLSVLFILVLFICVVMHEFGHSLTARRYGIQTDSITLLPIGGMANIEKMPEEPKQEILVTLAGLLVNVAIAFILGVIIYLVPDFSFTAEFEAITAQNFVILLMYTNLFIVGFNLIPAFPMDGGRILRAALSFRFNRVKATRYSMIAGQVFGGIFAVIGLFINPFLFVIGIFVFLGAGSEYAQVKYGALLSDYTAKDVVMNDYSLFHPDEQLQKAVDVMLKTSQTGFLAGEGDHILGVLLKDNLIKGLSQRDDDVRVRDVMTRDFKKVENNTPLQEVFTFMQKKKIGLLPVFDDGKLVGVIDKENLQEFVMVKLALQGKEE